MKKILYLNVFSFSVFILSHSDSGAMMVPVHHEENQIVALAGSIRTDESIRRLDTAYATGTQKLESHIASANQFKSRRLELINLASTLSLTVSGAPPAMFSAIVSHINGQKKRSLIYSKIIKNTPQARVSMKRL